MSSELDREQRRRAFTGLLAAPVVDARTDPELWPLVRRHRAVLADWFTERLGYRLTVTDRAARLYRLPGNGRVVAPHRARPPSRRVLVLALLTAAAAEDADDLTTVQELSDRVRAIAARPDVGLTPYQPDRFAERRLFARAVQQLTELGALRPAGRDGDEALERWAHRAGSHGGAHHVERELLLRLVDPACLVAALDGTESGEVPDERSRRFTVMRRLVELPVCLLADLSDAERGYLVSQRHRLLAWAHEMTGWVAEQRAEGIALIPADESGTDRPFPRVRADHFGALMMLDHLQGRDHLDAEALVGAAVTVSAEHPKSMTAAMREDPAALADTAAALLSELDLLRPAQPTGWRVMPAAARFRGPTVLAAPEDQTHEDQTPGTLDDGEDR